MAIFQFFLIGLLSILPIIFYLPLLSISIYHHPSIYLSTYNNLSVIYQYYRFSSIITYLSIIYHWLSKFHVGQLLVAGGASPGRDGGRRDGRTEPGRLLVRRPGPQALWRCL